MDQGNQFDGAGTAGAQLLAWLELAGLPTVLDGDRKGRTYLRKDLAPLVAAFRDAMSPISERLTDSCRELLEFGMNAMKSDSPRVRLADIDRVAFQRGLGIFVAEANTLSAAGAGGAEGHAHAGQ